MKRSFFSVAVLGFVLAFLYVPILLVVVYGFIPNGITMSFFDAKGEFTGFTMKWYEQIFSGNRSVSALLDSFWLSLTIAGLATLVSSVIGTTSALALHRWKGRLQSIHHALVYTPLIMPDILIGISLLMLFVAVKVDCGFWTILIAHVTFCVSYVVISRACRTSTTASRRRPMTLVRGRGTRSSTWSCRFSFRASWRADFLPLRFRLTMW